jgi:hypothetical protein
VPKVPLRKETNTAWQRMQVAVLWISGLAKGRWGSTATPDGAVNDNDSRRGCNLHVCLEAWSESHAAGVQVNTSFVRCPRPSQTVFEEKVGDGDWAQFAGIVVGCVTSRGQKEVARSVVGSVGFCLFSRRTGASIQSLQV